MSRLTKLISLAALLVAPSMATAAEVNVVSWGGAYTESQKLGYGDPYQEMSGVQVNWIDYSGGLSEICLLYTSPSPRDMRRSRMPSSA